MSWRDGFDPIEQALLDAGGIREVPMEELRNALPAGRIGCEVRESIERELKRRAIRHLPPRLPTDHRHMVTLFHLGTAAGRVLDGAVELARLSAADGPAEAAV